MSQFRSHSKAEINRSASHTGIPARFLTPKPNTPGELRPAHMRGPRLARSASESQKGTFNLEAVGMHDSHSVTPLRIAIPKRADTKVSPIPHSKPGRTIPFPLPRRRSSLRHVLSDLRVNTNHVSPTLAGNRTEIAMEVAEEVARLCKASEPIPTDIPLAAAGMTTKTAGRVGDWLLARFDFPRTARQLMGDGVTAESLAADILTACPVASPQRPWCTGEIPIMFDGMFDESGDDSEDSEVEDVLALSRSTKEDFRGRTSKATVVVPPILVSPPPPTTPLATRPLNIKKAPRGAGAQDSRIGRKTGLAVGLLAMGAFLTSPSRTAFDISVPETPSPPSAFGSYFGRDAANESAFDMIDWSGSLSGTNVAFGVEAGHDRLGHRNDGNHQRM